MSCCVYTNALSKLEQFGLTCTVTKEELKLNKRITYTCKHNHTNNLAIASFNNKSTPSKIKNIVSLCQTCQNFHDHEIEMKPRFTDLGFELLSFIYTKEGYRKVTYKCGCGNVSSCDWRQIKNPKRTSFCCKCQNDKNKIPYSKLSDTFNTAGCKLLTQKHEYVNNKQKLNYECNCGNKAEIVYHDFVIGKRCGNCKTDRTRATNLEKYGVENTFQSTKIKDKIRTANLERLGVEYPQQSPEVRIKTETTCLHKYGYKWAFTAPEVYDKIKKIMFQKYGVEYPMQCSEILEKIKYTCRSKYGTDFYINSNASKQHMQMLHGVDYYGMSKEFRTKMLEKYGAEYFVQSEECKRQMVEKYGAEHAMQCPVLFRKACASSFRRRPYFFNDKLFMILGYEDKALDDLLKRENITVVYAGEDENIPVFEYTYLDGKKKIYYPDMYLPEDNRIIEVKSVWTYNIDSVKTLHKGLCVSENYIFELRIYDKTSILFVIEIVKGKIFQTHGDKTFVLGEKIKTI